jgi:hypothetical protein
MQSVFAGNFPPSNVREEDEVPSSTEPVPAASMLPLTNLQRHRNQQRQQKRMQRHAMDFVAEARYIVCMVVLLVSILLLQRSIAFLFRYYMKLYKGYDQYQIAWWQLVLSIFLISLVVIFAILWHDTATEDVE